MPITLFDEEQEALFTKPHTAIADDDCDDDDLSIEGEGAVIDASLVPIPGTLYLDHRAKQTGKDTYDAALEVIGFAHNDDANATVVLYRNLKDGTNHVIGLNAFLEPVEVLFADGWRVVTRFVPIGGPLS